MAYMTRLGLWGAGTSFADFNHFIQAIEQRGVGAMELVAMDMKLRGMYIARQLSFSGVHFSILDVPLSNEYLQTYDRSVQLVIVSLCYVLMIVVLTFSVDRDQRETFTSI